MNYEHRRTITAGTGAELVEGRPRVPDRQALCGILLRAEHRHPVGVPALLHAVLLKKLRAKSKRA